MPTNRAEARPMGILGRGVVFVRSSGTGALVSRRLLRLDDDCIGFNVYRNGEPLNSDVLPGGTNFVGLDADLSEPNTYHARPVVDGDGAGGERRVHAAGRRPPWNLSSVRRSAAATPSSSSGSPTPMAMAST
ncbi:hypothetical protein DL771_007975 [Monosporascus sp. 5C6A]|nr:hypothetical protein DL771_007975 [Monosporascus sp. 5C6A]